MRICLGAIPLESLWDFNDVKKKKLEGISKTDFSINIFSWSCRHKTLGYELYTPTYKTSNQILRS